MDTDESRLYEITVAGVLDPTWSDWLDDLVVTTRDGKPAITMLRGPLDQTALRGVLNRLWDLNLTLISVLPDRQHPLTEEIGGRDED